MGYLSGVTRTRAVSDLGDSVDALIADWERERPDLDASPIGVVVRLARLRSEIGSETLQTFERYDLSAADFVVIVSLRRAGAPYQLTQTALAQRLALTSGTVSVRVDRLVRKGIVVREDDASDGRVQQVRLTDAGLSLFDEIAPAHLATGDRLLSALTPAQREQLAALLRTLLRSFEHETFSVPALGLRLTAAHASRARRLAVGLSDLAGLLVADPPTSGSPTAKAGLKQGDLITMLGGVAARGVEVVDRVVPRRRGTRTIAIEYVRGERRRKAELTINP